MRRYKESDNFEKNDLFICTTEYLESNGITYGRYKIPIFNDIVVWYEDVKNEMMSDDLKNELENEYQKMLRLEKLERILL